MGDQVSLLAVFNPEKVEFNLPLCLVDGFQYAVEAFIIILGFNNSFSEYNKLLKGLLNQVVTLLYK